MEDLEDIDAIFAARAAEIAAMEDPSDPEHDSTRELWDNLHHDYRMKTDPQYLDKIIEAEERELAREIGDDLVYGPDTDSTPPVRLYVDLVPVTAWRDNVRSAVSSFAWRAIAAEVLARANGECVCCGCKTNVLEAHERWDFDGLTGVQRLVGIEALCKLCHLSTHIGLADKLGLGPVARFQLRRVNHWTVGQVEQHIDDSLVLFHERSGRSWTLDISLITSECAI